MVTTLWQVIFGLASGRKAARNRRCSTATVLRLGIFQRFAMSIREQVHEDWLCRKRSGLLEHSRFECGGQKRLTCRCGVYLSAQRSRAEFGCRSVALVARARPFVGKVDQGLCGSSNNFRRPSPDRHDHRLRPVRIAHHPFFHAFPPLADQTCRSDSDTAFAVYLFDRAYFIGSRASRLRSPIGAAAPSFCAVTHYFI